LPSPLSSFDGGETYVNVNVPVNVNDLDLPRVATPESQRDRAIPTF